MGLAPMFTTPSPNDLTGALVDEHRPERAPRVAVRLRDGKAHVFLVLGQLGRCHGLRVGQLLQRSQARRGSCPGDDNSAAGQAIHGRDPCVVTLEELQEEQKAEWRILSSTYMTYMTRTSRGKPGAN